jgi:hypothetical protein
MDTARLQPTIVASAYSQQERKKERKKERSRRAYQQLSPADSMRTQFPVASFKTLLVFLFYVKTAMERGEGTM